MMNKDSNHPVLDDPTSSDRKKDHIDLAFDSATSAPQRDGRFYYEPMLSAFPDKGEKASIKFLGKTLTYPIWVSSMTGGTGIAKHINKNLAIACKDFGLGMGLGSCRKLLTSNEYLEDFAVRKYIGDQPLYANLGIAQIIEQIQANDLTTVDQMIQRLEADGLIIHINPLQEWMQPEGDVITGMTPIEAVKRCLDHFTCPIVIKEVGQGMGPESLRALLALPVAAIEFGAFGGTNFAKLEALRDPRTDLIDPICYVGHTPEEMIRYIKQIGADIHLRCDQFIISGGVKDYMDGYYYNETLPYPSLYGQASGFLKHAMGDYDSLAAYVEGQTKGYAFANRYLKVKEQ